MKERENRIRVPSTLSGKADNCHKIRVMSKVTVDDTKIQECRCFFFLILLSSFLYSSTVFYFFLSLGVIYRPSGVGISTCVAHLMQRNAFFINTVFINRVIYTK